MTTDLEAARAGALARKNWLPSDYLARPTVGGSWKVTGIKQAVQAAVNALADAWVLEHNALLPDWAERAARKEATTLLGRGCDVLHVVWAVGMTPAIRRLYEDTFRAGAGEAPFFDVVDDVARQARSLLAQGAKWHDVSDAVMQAAQQRDAHVLSTYRKLVAQGMRVEDAYDAALALLEGESSQELDRHYEAALALLGADAA